MQLNINSIVINKRIRKSSGNIEKLAESMDKYGQMHPVIVNKKMELISGFRRIESAKSLNWKTVFAIVMDIEDESDKLTLELEENLRRKDFTEEEKIEAYKRITQLNKPTLFKKLLKFIKKIMNKIFNK